VCEPARYGVGLETGVAEATGAVGDAETVAGFEAAGDGEAVGPAGLTGVFFGVDTYVWAGESSVLVRPVP
jgi:hypothetical protein